jgi:hypothetical protein
MFMYYIILNINLYTSFLLDIYKPANQFAEQLCKLREIPRYARNDRLMYCL